MVEIHIRASALTALIGLVRAGHPPPGWASWAALIAEMAIHQRHRDRELARLDRHPGARYPSAGLRRHVQIRDRTCVAPGCRRPARKADIDHTHDHARGGTTIQANTEPLCLAHHLMKHRGWTLLQPEPGRFCWQAPLGQTYRTRGEPIAADLPPPCPTPPPLEEDDEDDTTEEPTPPIFDLVLWRKLRRPPDPPPAPPPPADPDTPPPF